MSNLKQLIDNSDNIVFFGGAGVSTESGIPDFRSADGLYNTKYKYLSAGLRSPETIISHTFFVNHTAEFYEFYRDKMIFKNAKPNDAHIALAKLEQRGKLKAIVTQNIDGLHTLAGNKNVYELHGSVHRNYCVKCGKFYDLDFIISNSGVPKCDCGGVVKPDVVLYEEGLEQKTLSAAVNAIANADMLIVGGTSLTVYPAAGLVDYYKGSKLVLINKSATQYDSRADLVISESIGETLCNAILRGEK